MMILIFQSIQSNGSLEKGLAGAGEWHELKTVLPDFTGKRVLDLGCGYGWHCRYAAEHGAKTVLGIDTSAKMLAEAAMMTHDQPIVYQQMDMQAIDQLPGSFDVILSSLAIHYIADYAGLVQKISAKLPVGGQFIMSVEHPFLRLKVTRHGSKMIAGITFIGRWTDILRKVSVKPSF